MIYWTVRNTSPRRWQPEAGWAKRESAEPAAAFYRREYRRRCVVVEIPEGTDHDRFGELLLAAVMSA